MIVVDKQYGYFSHAYATGVRAIPKNSEEIVSSIDSLVELARERGVEVIWTQMVETEKLSPPPIAEMLKNGSNGVNSITEPGHESYEIYGRIKPENDEKIIEKYRYDAFAQTDLANYLKDRGIKSVVLVGGYATRCVLSTAVGANGNDLKCLVVKDLVTNQATAENEIPLLFNVVDAILGESISCPKLVEALEANK